MLMEFLINLPLIYYVITANTIFIIYLLILLILDVRVIYFGAVIIFLQIITIFFAVVNRSLGSGFEITYFFYMVSIPVIVPLLSNYFRKRNRHRQTFFKKLIFRFNSHLDSSFFNLFYLNNGLFYLSKKYFPFFEIYGRAIIKLPQEIMLRFYIYPWGFFLFVLILELLLYNKVYFGAILFSVNLLINRGFLLFLRIVDYNGRENLEFIEANFLLLPQQQNQNKDSLHVWYQNPDNIDKILCNYSQTDENYIINKIHPIFSSITYSSAIVSVHILVKYLLPYYRNILNTITLNVVAIAFWGITPIFFAFLLMLTSHFFVRTKYKNVDLLIKQQLNLMEGVIIYKKNLIVQGYLSNKILDLPLILPPNPRPKNFVDWFSSIDSVNEDHETQTMILGFWIKNHILAYNNWYKTIAVFLWLLFLVQF